MKKKPYYINNKEFEATIANYQKDNEKYETELVGLLDILISNIIMSFKFSNIDHDDAKQECFVICLRTLKNFTPDKGSAFNYFTTVILNQLKLMFTKNKRYMQKINEYRETRGDVFSEPSFSPLKPL